MDDTLHLLSKKSSLKQNAFALLRYELCSLLHIGSPLNKFVGSQENPYFCTVSILN